MFDQKSYFQHRLAGTKPYKSRMGPNREKTWFSRASSSIT